MNYSTKFIICNYILFCLNKSNFLYMLHERMTRGPHVFIWCILSVSFVLHNKLTKRKERFLNLSLKSIVMRMDNSDCIRRWKLFLVYVGLLGPNTVYIRRFFSFNLFCSHSLLLSHSLTLSVSAPSFPRGEDIRAEMTSGFQMYLSINFKS